MSLRTQVKRIKTQRYGLFYFESDKTVSILPLKKILKVLEGDSISTGSIVQVIYGNLRLKAQIVAIHGDLKILEEEQLEFLSNPDNKELFADDQEEDQTNLTEIKKNERKRNADEQAIPLRNKKKRELNEGRKENTCICTCMHVEVKENEEQDQEGEEQEGKGQEEEGEQEGQGQDGEEQEREGQGEEGGEEEEQTGERQEEEEGQEERRDGEGRGNGEGRRDEQQEDQEGEDEGDLEEELGEEQEVEQEGDFSQLEEQKEQATVIGRFLPCRDECCPSKAKERPVFVSRNKIVVNKEKRASPMPKHTSCLCSHAHSMSLPPSAPNVFSPTLNPITVSPYSFHSSAFIPASGFVPSMPMAHPHSFPMSYGISSNANDISQLFSILARLEQKIDHLSSCVIMNGNSSHVNSPRVINAPSSDQEDEDDDDEEPVSNESTTCPCGKTSKIQSESDSRTVDNDTIILLKTRANNSHTNFAVQLVRRMFHTSEIIGRNVNGVRGKSQVDPVRINKIMELVHQNFPAAVAERDLMWRNCRKAIDSYLRKLRFKSV